MQFIRQVVLNKRIPNVRYISKVTHIKHESANVTKIPRYSAQNQQILDEYMIPGPALKFFKNKREKRKQDNNDNQMLLNMNDNLYTVPARPVSFNEFDSAPTIAQERLSERLKRAISTMYSVEVLPSPLLTLGYISIRDVKVSRNLRKCRVMYEPLSTDKKERGKVHRALNENRQLLNSLIQSHAQIKRPLSIKYVPDTQAKELEAIFEQISAEENKEH